MNRRNFLTTLSLAAGALVTKPVLAALSQLPSRKKAVPPPLKLSGDVIHSVGGCWIGELPSEFFNGSVYKHSPQGLLIKQLWLDGKEIPNDSWRFINCQGRSVVYVREDRWMTKIIGNVLSFRCHHNKYTYYFSHNTMSCMLRVDDEAFQGSLKPGLTNFREPRQKFPSDFGRAETHIVYNTI